MTEDEWGALVARLEVDARERPRAYARKVALLGAVGYLVIAFALAVLAALAVFVGILAAQGHRS
jgi:hypothetical protein